MPLNEFGQPTGDPITWSARSPVAPVALAGRSCGLEPLSSEHVPDLWQALCVDSSPELWTYMSAGPFPDRPALAAYVEMLIGTRGLVPLAIRGADESASGIACFMRDDPANGVVEVGTITLGTRLQRTVAATEAMHLMAAHAFEECGYRRYEWKCDSLNAPSRRAAERLGFAFEGVFRQAMVYKGRNRDTAWYSITDAEWPRVRDAHRHWLERANFDQGGRQLSSLRIPRAAG
ncbi:MAG: GNAT family protein [Marmoricola sp.]